MAMDYCTSGFVPVSVGGGRTVQASISKAGVACSATGMHCGLPAYIHVEMENT